MKLFADEEAIETYNSNTDLDLPPIAVKLFADEEAIETSCFPAHGSEGYGCETVRLMKKRLRRSYAGGSRQVEVPVKLFADEEAIETSMTIWFWAQAAATCETVR